MVGDVHSDGLYLLLPQLTPPLSSSRPEATRKHTGASAVGDVHSYAFYLLLPQLTPQLSSSRPRVHLPLSTPPSWSPIPKARRRDAAASVVVPETPIPRTYCLFLDLCQRLHCHHLFRGTGSERLLTFGFLTLYFFWRRLAGVYLTLLETALLKAVEVQTEYLDYFTRNIQSSD